MTAPLSPEHDVNNSSDDANEMSSGCKKGVPWSEDEHRAFLKGLQTLGKGNWRGISRMFVPSRSPTQVASHAQKYFLRLSGCTKRRSRFSGLEANPRMPHHTKPAPKATTCSNSSPTSSGEGPSQIPPLMMPMPFMFPHMMFAIPGSAPFIHPMFFQPSMAAAFSKLGGMMAVAPNCPAAPAAPAMPGATKVEGGDDSAGWPAAKATGQLDQLPCRPAARRTSNQSLASELLGLLNPTTASTCHVALQTSAGSAFRPAGRQLAAM